MGVNILASKGPKLITLAFGMRLPIQSLIKNTIFDLFCGGETIEECLDTTIVALQKHNVGAILDYSVEGLEREEDFESARDELLLVIETARTNEAVPFAVFKVTGMGRFALLEKINDEIELTDAEVKEFSKIKNRIY